MATDETETGCNEKRAKNPSYPFEDSSLKKKERLDIILLNRGLAKSRSKAQALILAGRVRVGSQIYDKVGQQVAVDLPLEIVQGDEFVSRAGKKLKKALLEFPEEIVRIKDKKCLDVGCSTGGFTDCLLKFGASHVTAIDVGYGQFDLGLKNDPRVNLIERTNFRYFHHKAEKEIFNVIVCDVSFISLRQLLKPFCYFSDSQTSWIFLIKPQFEAGRGKVGKNGVIKDIEVHLDVILSIQSEFKKSGWFMHALTFSPVKGPKGNIEFLALFIPERNHMQPRELLRDEIEKVVTESSELG
ncbi:TlyA family RNA methyltransferase [Candidatus Riflebacteria bacterium]